MVGGTCVLAAIPVWRYVGPRTAISSCVDAAVLPGQKRFARPQELVGEKGFSPTDSPGGATQFLLIAEPLADSFCQGHPGGHSWCQVRLPQSEGSDIGGIDASR